MSYKVIVGDKEFEISDNILKFKKCVITNTIKYYIESKIDPKDKLIFDRDSIIFENFVFPIIENKKIKFDYIYKFMNELYQDNFNSIIDYMNDVIYELKYFMLYYDLVSKNHMKSINNINEFMSISYRMQYMINKIEFDLNIIENNVKVETLCYYDIYLRDTGNFYRLHEIIKEKLKKYKYKNHIQFLEYVYLDEMNNGFYNKLEIELEKIKNVNDFNYLTDWYSYIEEKDIDEIKKIIDNNEKNDKQFDFDKTFKLIEKYKIKNQFQLFSQSEVYNNAILFDDLNNIGIPMCKCIGIVIYPSLE